MTFSLSWRVERSGAKPSRSLGKGGDCFPSVAMTRVKEIAMTTVQRAMRLQTNLIIQILPLLIHAINQVNLLLS